MSYQNGYSVRDDVLNRIRMRRTGALTGPSGEREFLGHAADDVEELLHELDTVVTDRLDGSEADLRHAEDRARELESELDEWRRECRARGRQIEQLEKERDSLRARVEELREDVTRAIAS